MAHIYQSEAVACELAQRGLEAVHTLADPAKFKAPSSVAASCFAEDSSLSSTDISVLVCFLFLVDICERFEIDITCNVYRSWGKALFILGADAT
eukprot:4611450-Amphidinium_carterae.1